MAEKNFYSQGKCCGIPKESYRHLLLVAENGQACGAVVPRCSCSALVRLCHCSIGLTVQQQLLKSVGYHAHPLKIPRCKWGIHFNQKG